MQKEIAELILYNGTIISLDDDCSIYNAIAVREGKIIALGDYAAIHQLHGFGTDEIDLKGQTVIPGFFDNAVHVMNTGIGTMGVNLNHLNSREEVFKAIKQAVDHMPENQFIYGYHFDDYMIGEPIDRFDLDKITMSHPVYIRRFDYHSAIVNSYMFNLLNLPWNIEGIVKNEEDIPTGLLKDRASMLARKKFVELAVDDRLRFKALENVNTEALKQGITTIQAMEGGFLFHDRDADFMHEKGKASLIDMILYYQITDVGKIKKKGLTRIGGCIFVDGTIGMGTAALEEPYYDDSTNMGIIYYSARELNDFILEAHLAGLQIAVHAIGERAIDLVLNAYENALEIYPSSNHRHRIEHFILPTDEQIKRAVNLGLIFSVHPAFDQLMGGPSGLYSKRIGARHSRVNPLRRIVDAGGMIIGSSESDISPMNPIFGIHASVNHTNPESSITPLEALKGFTINGAYSCFQEDKVGTLEIGKVADLAVLDINPLECDPSEICHIKVKMTIKRGKILFGL